MINIRQLEKRDAASATNLWATSMKGSNYGEWQKRIDKFVDSKLNDPDDMGDVFSSYVNVKSDTHVRTIGSRVVNDSFIETKTNCRNNISATADRNFWIVEYHSCSQPQGKFFISDPVKIHIWMICI